ncbi:MAG: hypothetical protein GY679_02310 [Mycoplasma sp.]|nr:hypothetical protein [Mycoplasma sp.]
MKTPDIVLWTISLTLTTFSILFAGFAAYSSSKANKRIKETISSEWIVSTTTKYFFDQIKTIQKSNNKVIKLLEQKISYSEYSHNSNHTRFSIIPTISKEIINGTEFSELLKYYTSCKKDLDLKFSSIIEFSKLSTKIEIPEETKNNLIEYHKKIQEKTKEILNLFVKVSSGVKNV